MLAVSVSPTATREMDQVERVNAAEARVMIPGE